MRNRSVNFIVKIAIVFIVILICVFAAFIYSHAKKDDTTANDKIEEEIDYLDIKLTGLINKINGIQLEFYEVAVTKVQEEESKSDSSEEEDSEEGTEQSEKEKQEGTSSGKETEITKMERRQTVEEGQTNWSLIQEEIEVFYSVWSSIILDLFEAGVESTQIVDFSNKIDELEMCIKAEDKAKSCEKIAELYSLLPEFANRSNMLEIKKSTISAKSNIMNAYASLETENWENATKEISEAETKFEKYVKDIGSQDESRKFNINKTYILIEEIKNSLPTKDKGIFYIKYKNLIQEMNSLM